MQIRAARAGLAKVSKLLLASHLENCVTSASPRDAAANPSRSPWLSPKEGETKMREIIVRTCAACGAKNRIPARHLADTGRCGGCQAALDPLAEPIDADAAAFDEIVAAASVPVLVDFWAPWCPPCRLAAPGVRKVAKGMAGRALVVKVDTDQHPELAARFGVRGIPNFVVLKGGRVVSQQAGLVSHQQMQSWLEQAEAA
jgi:thioredoxin 2